MNTLNWEWVNEGHKGLSDIVAVLKTLSSNPPIATKFPANTLGTASRY